MRYSSASNGRSNKPAGVSAYDVRTGKPGERAHDTKPCATNESSRSVSTFALNVGSPVAHASDARNADAVYEPGGLFVPEPGHTVTGAARQAANQRFLDLGLPIDVQPRHVYAHDGIALLIVDRTVGDVKGTATDVARRAADGRWRYVIDNPFGISWAAAPSRRS